MSDVLSTRKFEQDGFTVIVERIADDNPDADWLTDPARYSDVTDATERAKYEAQDAERLAALERGDWSFVGVAVTIRKQTATKWADGGLEVGRASCWGIESDSDESFFADIERDMITDAFAEVGALKEALFPA